MATLLFSRWSRRFLAFRRWFPLLLQVLIVLAVAGGFLAFYHFSTLPERMDQQQTILVGPTGLTPDSEAALRVVVQDRSAGRPIADAAVQVSLQPAAGAIIPLFSGRTDASGSLPVQFHVPPDLPADQPHRLIVEARSGVGYDRLEQSVTIRRDYRLLLSSDKPLYQPGQVIHMRALALSTLDQRPAAGATVDFLVQDPRGNKVFRQSVVASEFGVAAADFQLADLVNQGSYKLVVSVGKEGAPGFASAERTVEVRPYVLPKFAVQVSTDRSYYLPGQRVEGAVQADYFFGKPVAGGQVQIAGTVWEIERQVLLDLRGTTDENGTYAFSFDLPSYFAGSGLESGQAQFALEVTVIDQAEHAEQTSKVLPIAAEPLLIEAVAESGALKPGVENIVYILTSYPDGRPAPAHLLVTAPGAAEVALDSGEFGLAQFVFVPGAGSPTLSIRARDASGLEARRTVSFESEYGSDHVLLRADRAAYLVGESMHLVALTPVESGSIYLDIVKAGQTLSTRSAQVKDGRAEFVVDIGPDLYGTLELHAYKVLLDGTIVRDTRLVVVDAPNDIRIAIDADRDTYLPGESAWLSFRTTGSDGLGVRTALGLAIVDESVFALQEQDPGFAKLYFLLEQELLEPRYQIKSFELPGTIPPEEDRVRQAQDTAARASWAGVVANPLLAAASYPQKVEAVRQGQVQGFWSLGWISGIGLIVLPVALAVVVLIAVKRAHIAGPSFARFGIVLAILLGASVPLSCVLVLFSQALYRWSPGTEIGELLALIGLGLLALAGLGLLVLLVYAWVRGDVPSQFAALLGLAWDVLLVLMIVSFDRWDRLSQSYDSPPAGLILLALLAYVLVPAAFLLFGQGLWLQARRFAGAVATAVGAVGGLPVAMLPLMIVLLAFGGPRASAIFGTVYNSLDGGVPVMRQAAQPPVLATPAPLPEDRAGRAKSQTTAQEPPRLRQYFPETLYWNPEVLTDEGGYLSLTVPMADSITTWRLTALASSQDGRLGFATRGVRVFQDFFVDIDLPVALTEGDEIGIPVAVYNYLPTAQKVRLVAQEEPWFAFLGPSEQVLTIAASDVDVVYFPIRVTTFGRQGFQVTAWGEQMSDAIRRQVTVLPNGKEFSRSESDWLRESRTVALDIPAQAIPGTARVEVKIYPGVMAQVVEGLEKLLQVPYG